MLPDGVADVPGMGHAGAEQQPGATALAMPDDLGDGGAGDLAAVHRRLQVPGDELAAPGADAGDVELGFGPFRDDGAEVALLDHVEHRHVVGDVGEQPVLALVQQAAVEAVGRGGETHDLEQAGVDLVQLRQEGAVHAAVAAPQQVRLVDQHQVAALHPTGVAVDRLDAGEQHLGADVAAREASRVDAGRRLRPGPLQGRAVLLDQLLHVGEDQDAGVGPSGDGLANKARDDHALARAGGHHHEGVASAGGEVVVERLDGSTLIGAQREGHAKPPSRHAVPSAGR